MPEHNKAKDILIGVMAIAMIVIAGVAFYIYKHPRVAVQQQMEQATTTPQEFQGVETINFGTSTPPDFPINIPIEKEVKLEQSYAVYNPGQKQLTIVFQSTKTVKENYTLYADFLKKENWVISNKNESDGVSSLYGTKGSNDINVTFNNNAQSTSTKSQVSISILEK